LASPWAALAGTVAEVMNARSSAFITVTLIEPAMPTEVLLLAFSEMATEPASDQMAVLASDRTFADLSEATVAASFTKARGLSLVRGVKATSAGTEMLTVGCFGSAPTPSSFWALGGARVGSSLMPRSCWALVGAFLARAVSLGLRCGGALGVSDFATAA